MGWDEYPPLLPAPTGDFDERFARSSIGPGGSFIARAAKTGPSGGGESIPQDSVNKLIAKTHALYIAGRVEYTDVFGDVQTTEYLLFYGGTYGTPEDGSVTPHITGNRAT
jgi:hypothetical protein